MPPPSEKSVERSCIIRKSVKAYQAVLRKRSAEAGKATKPIPGPEIRPESIAPRKKGRDKASNPCG